MWKWKVRSDTGREKREKDEKIWKLFGIRLMRENNIFIEKLWDLLHCVLSTPRLHVHGRECVASGNGNLVNGNFSATQQQKILGKLMEGKFGSELWRASALGRTLPALIGQILVSLGKARQLRSEFSFLTSGTCGFCSPSQLCADLML